MRLSIVVTNINRDLITQRPVMVEITIFDQLGTKQSMQLIPASMCAGNLEIGQRLMLVPIDQFVLK